MQETTALQVEKKELSNALAKYAENPNTVLPKRHCTGKQKVIENKGDHCIAEEECWKVLERPGIWQEKQPKNIVRWRPTVASLCSTRNEEDKVHVSK